MREKTFAAISLSNRDYPSLAAKIAEAARWTEFAAGQGADLIVLPEALNLYYGDGDPDAMSFADAALADWQNAAQPLIDVARSRRVAVTVPVVVREGGALHNSFFLISREGKVAGRYNKTFPTPQELTEGVVPGKSGLIEWEGIRIAGGICFDCFFPTVFERQAAAGADIFLIPSLTPGGLHLNYYALSLGLPIVLAYPAYSRIIDIDGREIAGGGYRHETLRFGFGATVILATINFDRVALFANDNQAKIVAIQEKCGKRVRVHFRQEDCTFIVESRCPELSIDQVIQEFNLMPRGRFFKDCDALVSAARQNATRSVE